MKKQRWWRKDATLVRQGILSFESTLHPMLLLFVIAAPMVIDHEARGDSDGYTGAYDDDGDTRKKLVETTLIFSVRHIQPLSFP